MFQNFGYPPCGYMLYYPCNGVIPPDRQPFNIGWEMMSKPLVFPSTPQLALDRTTPIKKQTPQEAKKKPIQSPFRNTLTNLGNQIISFANSQSRSREALVKLFPTLSSYDIDEYYLYATKVRKFVTGYINLKKLQTVWRCDSSLENKLYHKIFLKLCRFYLENICIATLLTSRKLKKDVLRHHLLTRRKLIRILHH